MRSHLRSIRTLPLAAALLISAAAAAGTAGTAGTADTADTAGVTVAAVAAVAADAAGGFLADVRPLHVTGRVVDDATGMPLHNAQVYVRGTGIGTLTDRDGRYALDFPDLAFPGGSVRLVAQLIGYRAAETLARAADASAGDSLAVDFRLEAMSTGLEEMVITGAPALDGVQSMADGARSSVAAGYAAGAGRSHALPPRAHRGWPGSPGWNREQYAHIAENDFRSPEDSPLSTFSIDVDRASYSNVRRFLLREGRLPPVDAVQIEEMINYFTYDYDRPRGGHPVAVTTEVGEAPWADGHRLLRVGLASRPVATEDMPPANLVFLLDVSGSMASPDKLPLVQSSMRLLVDQMRPQDRVAIVVYAGAAGLVLEPTSGADKETILEAIHRLSAGGSTAGGEGLRLAYDVARKSFRPGGNNRVILATDGDFNVGESSDAAMIRLVEEKREQGTFLTVLGFGTGNLQSSKMQGLAQHGNGNYAYIDGLQEARKVLVGEMGGTLLTVAKDVKIQIEFNPTRVRAYRLLGYENRLLAAEDFNDDAKDAGELGAGHTVTALYEIVPAGVESEVLTGSVDPLRYGDSGSPDIRVPPRRGSELRDEGELAFVKVRYKAPSGGESRLLEHPVGQASHAHARVSDDFTFASAVAGFGMLLRESEHRGSISADRVLALAEDGLGDDPEGYRRGFLELVRSYQTLTARHAWEGRRR